MKILLLLFVLTASPCLIAQVTQANTPAPIDVAPANLPTDKSEPTPAPFHTTPDGPVLTCPKPSTSNMQSPIFKIGKEEGVTPPKLIHHEDPGFTDEARWKLGRGGQATAIVSLVVDKDGNPQNVCIAQVAGYGLDYLAAKAVWKYRFKPAMKGNTPVPVQTKVVVNFKIF